MCLKCPAGFFCPGGYSGKVPCPRGTFQVRLQGQKSSFFSLSCVLTFILYCFCVSPTECAGSKCMQEIASWVPCTAKRATTSNSMSHWILSARTRALGMYSVISWVLRASASNDQPSQVRCRKVPESTRASKMQASTQGNIRELGWSVAPDSVQLWELQPAHRSSAMPTGSARKIRVVPWASDGYRVRKEHLPALLRPGEMHPVRARIIRWLGGQEMPHAASPTSSGEKSPSSRRARCASRRTCESEEREFEACRD